MKKEVLNRSQEKYIFKLKQWKKEGYIQYKILTFSNPTAHSLGIPNSFDVYNISDGIIRTAPLPSDIKEKGIRAMVVC